MNLHIFGASGSGTTSLGSALSNKLNLRHFDSDNYYWKKTDPPFAQANSVEERHELLLADLDGLEGWILSGSMDSWSEPFLPLFDGVIFVQSDPNLRVKRLRDREYRDYGARIKKGGDMFEEHEYFVKWAHQYDKGELPGRSLKRHEAWMESLDCPILRVTNNDSFNIFIARVSDWLQESNFL